MKMKPCGSCGNLWQLPQGTTALRNGLSRRQPRGILTFEDEGREVMERRVPTSREHGILAPQPLWPPRLLLLALLNDAGDRIQEVLEWFPADFEWRPADFAWIGCSS
jgi:hypothetical protein